MSSKRRGIVQESEVTLSVREGVREFVGYWGAYAPKNGQHVEKEFLYNMSPLTLINGVSFIVQGSFQGDSMIFIVVSSVSRVFPGCPGCLY